MEVLQYIDSSGFELLTFILIILGASFGIVFGAIPGLTSTMGMALMLPLTFGLDPVNGLALLVGVYIGGESGGLVSATLLGIPGTSSSVATTFDGYPLSQKGFPAKALGLGITASFIGNIFGFLVLILFAPTISRYAVKVTPFDYFSITMFAISLIAILASGNMFKGLASGFLGILLASVGFSPIDGTARFAFDSVYLKSGFELLPLIIGLYGISEIIQNIGTGKSIKLDVKIKVKGLGYKFKELYSNTWNIIRSATIGVAIGILPGIGASLSNILAYTRAKTASKTPEKFGTGTPEGILASETANNANIGGAFIPLLTLGIPGDGVTAILIGGFMIHGISPGPGMMAANEELIFTIFISIVLGGIIVFLLQIMGIRLFPKILSIPQRYLYTILFVLMILGSYFGNYTIFNIWVMLFFGVLGYFMRQFNFPLVPLLLGFVLGPIAEENFRRAVMYSHGDYSVFLTKPISAIFIIATITLIIVYIYKEIKGNYNKQVN